MLDTVRPNSRIIVYDEFLVAEEWRDLLDFTLARAPSFGVTNVLTNGTDHVDFDTRRSVVLFDLEHIRPLFVGRLLAFFPQVLADLDYPWFPVSHVEVQLTGTGDGEFFRAHTDDGSGEVSTRAITFVYFFYREPCAFAGGELRIYDTVWDDDGVHATGPYRSVFPAQNQVVFFPSWYLHEILPVSSPSGRFEDRRFTVNGWLHR